MKYIALVFINVLIIRINSIRCDSSATNPEHKISKRMKGFITILCGQGIMGWSCGSLCIWNCTNYYINIYDHPFYRIGKLKYCNICKSIEEQPSDNTKGPEQDVELPQIEIGELVFGFNPNRSNSLLRLPQVPYKLLGPTRTASKPRYHNHHYSPEQIKTTPKLSDVNKCTCESGTDNGSDGGSGNGGIFEKGDGNVWRIESGVGSGNKSGSTRKSKGRSGEDAESRGGSQRVVKGGFGEDDESKDKPEQGVKSEDGSGFKIKSRFGSRGELRSRSGFENSGGIGTRNGFESREGFKSGHGGSGGGGKSGGSELALRSRKC